MKKENKTKTSWEKEFDKLVKRGLEFGVFDYPRIKSFIRTLLDQQREKLIKDFRAELKASLVQQKQELKEKVEGMKKEIRYEELDTRIGIDRLEYDGQEKEHAYNQALSDIINLLK